MSKIHLGTPWPLGSTVTTRGVNFSVAAPKASKLELVIFENENDKAPKEIISLGENHQSGDYWHIEVEGLSIGCCYCYRVFEKEGAESNEKNDPPFLLDPASRGIGGWGKYKRSPSEKESTFSSSFLKSLVCERNHFDFDSHPRPKHKLEKTIIYELHVGGFTSHPDSKIDSSLKGTFLGLKKKIPYLKDLGITTIELLPVFAFDYLDAPFGVNNYWGYSPINWFTPHQEFVAGQNPLEARDQFRDFVAASHDAGLEILIDVVYNHTTEGNQDGPTLSWKGFGESIYYHKDKKKGYLDVTGCGNSIAANNPITRNLILESMRCWANELGVDGFRFDLGIALSRGKNLAPLDSPPLFEEIEADPFLSDLKLISEPWDCGGLYRLADFPAKRISTWNGRFRDDIRKFWKGDKNCTWDLKDRLMGSQKLYKKNINSPKYSINFITSHDGFTLNDLVSFNIKHNLSNGENNRDGDNHNNNWNHGIEGPCLDKEIQHLRNKQKRNLLTTLVLSPGVPMLLMGDEVGRSQGGNNNTWCQDNPLGWMDWNHKNWDHDLQDFVLKLISLRTQLPEFFSPDSIYESQKENTKVKTCQFWIQWHGIKVNKPDWGDWSHTLGFSINKNNEGSAIWLGFNAYKESMLFDLPTPISPWKKYIDTSILKTKNVSKKPLANQSNVLLESNSFVLMVSSEYSKKIKL